MMRLNEETPATDFGDDRGSPCGSGSKGANQKSRNPAPFICALILIGDQIGHAWSDGEACTQCGEFKLLHLHHKRAIHEGGTNNLTNLVLLCEDCHSEAHGGRKFHYRNMPGNSDRTSAVEKRIRLINEAIASGRDVSFRYEKRDGTVTKRTITPRELRKLSIVELHNLMGGNVTISREGRLCMFGYCHLRGADRVFAIDRIQNLRLELTSTFSCHFYRIRCNHFGR